MEVGMRSFLRVFLVVAILISAAACVIAEPIALEYKFKQGEVNAYKVAMTMSVAAPQMAAASAPASARTEMTITYKTLEVLPDGSAKIEVSTSAPAMSEGGKNVSSGNAKGSTKVVVMSKQGQITSSEGEDSDMVSSSLQNMDFSGLLNGASRQILFPSGPVDVGQKWTQDAPMPFGGSKLSVSSTLVGLEGSGQEKNARIRQAFAGKINLGDVMKAMAGTSNMSPEQSAQMSQINGTVNITGDMQFLFSPNAGKMVRGGGDLTAKVIIGLPNNKNESASSSTKNINLTVSMQMNITRIK